MDTLAPDLRTMVRTPLTEAHVAAMRRIGVERAYAAGAAVTALGAAQDRFQYVLEGELEAVDPVTGGRYGGASLGPGQFVGEISFLNDGKVMLASRACTDSVLLEVPRDAMLRLMADVPEMSDIIVTVFAARRRRLLESQQAALTLLGADRDRQIRQIAAFASRNRIPYRSLDLDDHEAEDIAQACALLPRHPAVIFGTDTVVEDPSPRKIARLLGIDMALGADHVFDVLIVGGGPAGIAAAVYAGAEGLSALVVEDLTIGGQAGTSSRIENYMGFPTGISGADLCWRGEVQAMKFGTRFAVPRRAVHVAPLAAGGFCVTLDDGEEVRTRAIVIATGVQYRKLPIPRLEEFEGAGVYYAATDVEARYCRNTDVVVIGGGNSAGQAAMFLSRSARHVHVLIRGDGLAASMSSYLSERLDRDPAITLHRRTQVTGLHGTDRLEEATIRDGVMGQDWTLRTGAVFVMVGAAPNTGWLDGLVTLDDKGFVHTGPEVGGRSTYETSCPGIFAVGDVRAGSVKRVASGVGEGSVVISKVWEHVNAP
ncbi:putative thioredoxin reductase trxB with an additional cyclic nucleotide-monophosphate binding domain [Dinoroseobacter shibae DFL 12 = DSM 16493]|jgi:thioredoxin reductase (NADPH)|uniref:Thioredoxin reductase n=1 Tax=Dinoroseobacter shibae (strain DSM 16493 / NCIMB 14021 / DFL 12) TaxID=398580 RepID=A8LNZ4_DINSH|nr:FAD-dependent oxidoreductase [Dinoroseobacter shibae]ABV93676.1 putative thioredoxin reductase trxB with an additional cyclic nucleotide-monophosphate binding domain [Dinoroseobacter shibae DFL 12 = DSM 16493]URF45129.1 FAD-dependent oxidoreductase [Dinoroseobacter shibae]URF49434.1 FAD-dependent oxidoreductase [Dinoroseobacter shibae]